jgi:uncharacterized membrane protein
MNTFQNGGVLVILQKIISIAIVMLLVDSVYLSFSKHHFSRVVRSIQKTDMNIDIWGAILSYSALIVGFYWFIASRHSSSLMDAVILGWVIYFVFDGTNKALFKNYGWDSVILDGVWGGLLFGIVYIILKYLRIF